MFRACVAKCPAESSARTVKPYEPAVVGHPCRLPSVPKSSPGGSVPAEMLKRFGCTPPVATTACPYARPIVPDGRLDVRTARISLMRIDIACTFECRAGFDESVTCTAKLNNPAALGVPDGIAPLSLMFDELRPGGRLPESLAK